MHKSTKQPVVIVTKPNVLGVWMTILLWVGLAAGGCTTTATSSSGEVSGFDITGQPASCKPASADIICTMVFTRQDRWAAKCRNAGAEAIQCGCHTYICKKKVLP